MSRIGSTRPAAETVAVWPAASAVRQQVSAAGGQRDADASKMMEGAVAVPSEQSAPPLGDLRFRTLLGEAQWSRLHPAVRRRFSKLLAPGEVALYRGKVVATELSRVGRLLALAARVIGAPLPLANGATGPAVVAVSEDRALGGQSWVRMYARAGRAPQVIHSAKRFRGPTGLEEHVGFGIGMSLSVAEEDGALAFRSARYYVEFGGRRLWLPAALTPGRMTIVHREEADSSFSFHLTLDHPRLGRLIDQLASFRDVPG